MPYGQQQQQQGFNEKQASVEAGLNMAKIRYLLMKKLVWSYDDWLVATNFFGNYRIREYLDPDDETNYTNARWEINDPEPEDDDGKPQKPITAGMLPDDIGSMLANPYTTAYYKALFDFSFWKVMDQLDPVSRGYVYSWSPGQIPYKKYLELSDYYWVQWMTGGNSGVLAGKKGSGKTSISLNLGAKHNKYWSENGDYAGAMFLTNVKILDDAYKDTYFSTFGEMLVKLFDNMSKRIKTLIIVDELTMNNIRKKKTMKGNTLQIDQFDKGTRKFDADIMYVWHSVEEVPEEVFRYLSFIVQKEGGTDSTNQRKKALVTFKDGNRQTVDMVRGIPGSPIPYVTKALAPFVLDIVWDDVMSEYTKLEQATGYNHEEIAGKMRDIVNEMVLKHRGDEEDEPDPKDRLPMETGISKQELALSYQLTVKEFEKLVSIEPEFKLVETYPGRYIFKGGKTDMGSFADRVMQYNRAQKIKHGNLADTVKDMESEDEDGEDGDDN